MGRYDEYKEWQDKVIGIGSILRKKESFIDERDRKLLEETTEVAMRAKNYFEIHPERRRHHEKERQDSIEEMYDSINVVSIVLGIVNEPIPKHLMLQQLLIHYPKYRSMPRIRSVKTRQEDYADKELFDLWEKELHHVNGDISRKMQSGVYSMDDRFDIAYRNLLKCIREIEKSVSTLPMSYGELEAEAEDEGRIIHPLFDLKVSAGDMINNTSICMGIFGQPLPPYPEMYKKLLLRDDRYGTG